MESSQNECQLVPQTWPTCVRRVGRVSRLPEDEHAHQPRGVLAFGAWAAWGGDGGGV